jgi:hypothetical protein
LGAGSRLLRTPPTDWPEIGYGKDLGWGGLAERGHFRNQEEQVSFSTLAAAKKLFPSRLNSHLDAIHLPGWKIKISAKSGRDVGVKGAREAEEGRKAE